MTAIGEVRMCQGGCRHEVILMPLLGWRHVNILDDLDCEAE